MTAAAIDLTGFRRATLRDQPQPQLIWARIEDLVIDRRYQRDLTSKGRGAIQRIANGWDWRKFQPILVAPAEMGKLAVVDGQHRAHAAALVGLEAIPAMTVAMTLAEQSAGFAAVNRDRVSVSLHQVYRAELAAGVEWAVRARAAVEAAGCELASGKPSWASRKAGRITQIGLVKRMIQAGEDAAITAGLRGIRDSDQGGAAESFDSVNVSPWLQAIARDQRFLSLPLSTIFDGFDIQHLTDAAAPAARQKGVARIKLVIDVLVAALSKHLDQAA